MKQLLLLSMILAALTMAACHDEETRSESSSSCTINGNPC